MSECEERQRLEEEKRDLEQKLLNGGTIGALFGFIQRVYEINDVLDALDSDERAMAESLSYYREESAITVTGPGGMKISGQWVGPACEPTTTTAPVSPVIDQEPLDIDVEYEMKKAKAICRSLPPSVARDCVARWLHAAKAEYARAIANTIKEFVTMGDKT